MNDIPKDTSRSHSFLPGSVLRVNIKCCSNVTNVIVTKQSLSVLLLLRGDLMGKVGKKLLAFPFLVRDN